MTADLLTLAQNLARRAGTQARIGRSQGMHVVGTKLTDTDMVTKFDREAESMIIAGLRAARPDDSIVGEEGGGHRGTSGVEWHVDPIDGTTSFMYGLPTWCVTIGAQDADGALVGASFEPSDHVVGVASRCDHHNGHAAFGANPPTQLETIDARQHDVDQHHIGRVSDK